MDKKIHYGIYAIIFNQDKTKILTVHKILGFYKGQYDLPGGAPEIGETKEETLKRELIEEIGTSINCTNLWYEISFQITKNSMGEAINFLHKALFTVGEVRDVDSDQFCVKRICDSDLVKWIDLEGWPENKELSLLVKMALRRYYKDN